MQYFSIVVVGLNTESALENLMRTLESQSIGFCRLEVILVDDGSLVPVSERMSVWQQRYQANVRYIHGKYKGIPAARNAGIALATGDWVTFCNPEDSLSLDYFKRIETFIHQHKASSLILITTQLRPGQNSRLEPIDRMETVPGRATSCFLQNKQLKSSRAMFDDRVRSGFEDLALIARYLLASESGCVGWFSTEHVKAEDDIPYPISWVNEATYGTAIHGYLSLLKDAVQAKGIVPGWLQRAILDELQLYFKTDMSPSAPTRVVSEKLAVQFHDLVHQVMTYIDVSIIETLYLNSSDTMVGHALLSYKNIESHLPVMVTAYDHGQGLVGFSYFVHGHKPVEAFKMDGELVALAYAKYRSCQFFRRTLFFKRIGWLPDRKAKVMTVILDNAPAPIMIDRQASRQSQADKQADGSVCLELVRKGFPLEKSGQQPRPFGLKGVKVRLLRRLARLAVIRKKFADAWVFTDSQFDADDNAEHLYRWVRKNHPEINAWYLLDRNSPDWGRLRKEGFLLVPRSWLRKLLLLNCQYVISSHADYSSKWYVRQHYFEWITWEFVFLPHGICIHDVSNWFNTQQFDLFITCGLQEYESIAASGTPYDLTAKEVKLTSFPRHDSLLNLADATPASEVNIIVVMPTWRGSIVNEDISYVPTQIEIEKFSDSQYAKKWSEFFNSFELQCISKMRDLKIVFMPHPNVAQYVQGFQVPAYIEIFTKADIPIQKLFSQCAILVTDYSSVAFEMGLLQRAVLFYQFDRDSFYGTGHTWRQGCFDYENDGFGPVCENLSEVFYHLKHIVDNNLEPDQVFCERMKQFFPYRDGQACKRVFENILALKQPFKY